MHIYIYMKHDSGKVQQVLGHNGNCPWYQCINNHSANLIVPQ